MGTLRSGLSLGLGIVVALQLVGAEALAQTGGATKPAKAPAGSAAVGKAAPAHAARATAPTAVSSADSAPPNSATVATNNPSAVNAPDVVQLKNGGILKGTISELVPGEYVTLVLITGETRKIAFADLKYAGAAAAAPTSSSASGAAAAERTVHSNSNQSSSARPFAIVHADESTVNVESDDEGLTLFRRAASAGFGGFGTVSGYEEVCTAPCNVSMPAGTHTFAVAKPGGKPVEVDPVTLPSGNTNMKISTVDRTAIRVVLGVAGGAALIGGFALMLSNTGSDSSKSLVAPIVLVSLGAGAVGLAIGIHDGAEVALGEGATAASGDPSHAAARWLGYRQRDAAALRSRPAGLTLTVHF